MIGRHPSYDALSRHADGELPATKAMELNGHLARCTRCRDEVDFIIELRRRLRDLAVPPLREDLLSDVLAEREAGERRILPLETPLDEERGSRVKEGVAAMVAAVGFALIGIALIAVEPTSAGAGHLDIESEPGTHALELEYSTSGPLAAEETLVIRGEYYLSGDVRYGEYPAGTPIRASLKRIGGGEFTGDLRLPSTVAYARFVVEDPAGTLVDRGPSGEWEYLGRDESGQPTFDALWRRALALVKSDPSAALPTAERIVALYPDRPEGWALLRSIESQVPSPAGGEREDEHRERLAAFLADIPDRPSPDDLATLAAYAGALGAQEARMALQMRLQNLAPGHPDAVDARGTDLYVSLHDRPTEFLAALEAEWARYGRMGEDLLRPALEGAVRAGDAKTALRWADRWSTVNPAAAPEVARTLARLPALADEAASRLRTAIRDLDARAERRPLGATESAHAVAVGREKAELLASLGHLLLEGGRRLEGVETLARAAEILWEPELFERVVRLFDELGRADRAARYRLLALADPLLEPEGGERIRAELAAAGLSAEAIATGLTEARMELERRLLDAGVRGLFPQGPLLVETPEGAPVDLLDYLREAPTVLLVWNPHHSDSRTFLDSLLATCDRLWSAGIRVIAVARDASPPSAWPSAVSACSGVVPLVDVDQQVRVAVGSRTFFEALVLDEAGQVRAIPSGIPDILRAALLLVMRD